MSGDKLIRTPVYRDMSLCHSRKKERRKHWNSQKKKKAKWNREFHTIAGRQINYCFIQHWQRA